MNEQQRAAALRLAHQLDFLTQPFAHEAADFLRSIAGKQDDIERLSNELHGALIAQTEIGDALCQVLDLLPDPHLDPDKVQAHFVRQARQVLDAYSESAPQVKVAP